MCLECEAHESDKIEENWIECENCSNWYHVACVGLENLTLEELEATNLKLLTNQPQWTGP